jgi:hypothetical protein
MDLWFGDSWTIGEEIQPATEPYDRSVFPNINDTFENPFKAFSTYVSTQRSNEYINFAKSASSIDFALYNLLKIFANETSEDFQKIKEKIQEDAGPHTAFLCLTAQVRGFGIAYPLIKHRHYHTSIRKSVHNTEIYDSLVAINCFYSVCKNSNINCIIIPIFTDLVIPKEFEHIVLFESAILSKTSLVELTFGEKLIDDSLYNNPELSEAEIYKHLQQKEWISPNRMHPNIIGHRKLAYKLIELLENH